MCTTFLTVGEKIEYPDGMPPRPEHPRFVNMGDEVAFAIAKQGEMIWRELRFGITPAHSSTMPLITTATEERLETTEQWSQMIRQRCAIPVHGHRWSHKQDWVSRPSGWALGFYDLDEGGGAALISELIDGQRSLVLVDARTVRAWLFAKQWEAIPVLRNADRLPVAMAA